MPNITIYLDAETYNKFMNKSELDQATIRNKAKKVIKHELGD
jgi:hypothetical protein